jgi:hypothetical protein
MYGQQAWLTTNWGGGENRRRAVWGRAEDKGWKTYIDSLREVDDAVLYHLL